MCSKTAVAPLDRMKILFQAHNNHYKNLGMLSFNRSILGGHIYLQLKIVIIFLKVIFCCRLLTILFLLFTGVWSGLKAIVKNESVIALYKGNGAQMVRIFPYAAIQFTTYAFYKEVYILGILN